MEKALLYLTYPRDPSVPVVILSVYLIEIRPKVRADRISLSPDPDVIHPQLLREWSAGVRAADEIASNCNVENDKELALELLRAVNSSRDVGLVILNPIYEPSDGRACAGKSVCVEPGREGNG